MKTMEAAKPGSARWRWIALVATAIILVVVGWLFPLQEWLTELSSRAAGLGPAGVAIYAGLYALAAVLFVPGSLLTLGAGFLFGLLPGTLAVSLGSTLAAALAFLIARYVARDRIATLATRNKKFAVVDEAIGKQGWKIVLLLRLSPLIPFNLSNYLYGLTAIPFWPYLVASWAAMLPGTLLYVYLGVAGRAGLEVTGQSAGRDWLQTAFLVTGLIATAVVSWLVSRIARKALQKINPTSVEASWN